MVSPLRPLGRSKIARAGSLNDSVVAAMARVLQPAR